MAEYVVEEPSDRSASWRVHERIVRCRDCKHTAPYGDGIECLGPLVQTWDYYNDEPLDNPVQPDGFCAWGERKEVDA